MRTVTWLGVMLAGAVSLLTVPASAQESGATLEEITVTAQRREESLQQTPVTLSALTAEQLVDQGIVNLQSVTKTVPNLMIQPISASTVTSSVRTTSSSRFSIRRRRGRCSRRTSIAAQRSCRCGRGRSRCRRC